MNTILFDLDGTLLPMDMQEFTEKYFRLIAQTMYENKRDGKQIVQAILKATMAMVSNDGSNSNEALFWKVFSEATQISRKEIEPEFLFFYEHIFDRINSNQQSPHMIEAVELLKEKGYRLYLTTNPLFPSVATEKRIQWAGLHPKDFLNITTYENSSFCKPNPAYYEEFLCRYHIAKEDCMMVGNDVKEDGIIETLGIPLFLVDDYLLNQEQLPITCRWKGDSSAFLSFVKQLPNV